MTEVRYLVSASDSDAEFWRHRKFFNTYDEAVRYIQQTLKPGEEHRIKEFTREQAKEAGLEEEWVECDPPKTGKTTTKYKLVVKKNKDGNFTIWKIDKHGYYYPILNADEELLKKMAKTLKKAGF